jgi:hypothetical protein
MAYNKRAQYIIVGNICFLQLGTNMEKALGANPVVQNNQINSGKEITNGYPVLRIVDSA